MDVSKDLSWIDFEDEVFRNVQHELQISVLYLDPNKSSVIRKKKYFSPDRNAQIEFEISIESYDFDSVEPSAVWVWECKDKAKSNRNVEVEEVEKLISKIQQLGLSRFRASLVTNSGFQESAISLAKRHGIGLYVLNKKLIKVFQFSEARPNPVDKVIVSVSFGIDEFGSYTGGRLDGLLNTRWPKIRNHLQDRQKT